MKKSVDKTTVIKVKQSSTLNTLANTTFMIVGLFALTLLLGFSKTSESKADIMQDTKGQIVQETNTIEYYPVDDPIFVEGTLEAIENDKLIVNTESGVKSYYFGNNCIGEVEVGSDCVLVVDSKTFLVQELLNRD